LSIAYDPESGRKMLNRYEIIRQLGRGQHGKVKLARNLETGEYVAIKIVDRTSRPRLGKLQRRENSQEEKIRKEIAIMKKCIHPNIVRLKEVLDDNSSRKIYLVLEYLEKGEVVWQTSDGKAAMTRDEARNAARCVLLGLEYLHFQGIIHRDIKPANLLLSKDDNVKISDFGVSYISSSLDVDELELAKTAGTPAFFAPELCVSGPARAPITHKIDIWAYGVTLYCLLFGTVPFTADSEYELFEVIANDPLVFPDDEERQQELRETRKEAYPSQVDADMEMAKDLLRKLLEKDPEKRIDVPEIKRHPWIVEGLAEEILPETEEVRRIEVTEGEVRAAVQGITSRIRRGLSRFGSTALEIAGLRRRGSGASLNKGSSDGSSGGGTTSGTQTPPQRCSSLRSEAQWAGWEHRRQHSGPPDVLEARRPSAHSIMSTSTVGSTLGETLSAALDSSAHSNNIGNIKSPSDESMESACNKSIDNAKQR
jgi:serine/threonine protein kinase